jgi:hypothetical protein
MAIKSRLASQLRSLSRNQQIELYNVFARVPQTRKMTNTLFEAIGQDVLPEGLNITLFQLTRKLNAVGTQADMSRAEFSPVP